MVTGKIGAQNVAEKARRSMDKKMFLFNEDGVAEWIVAESIEQAIKFYEEVTGGSMAQTFNLDKNLYGSWEEFVDGYVKEEPLDKVFNYHDYRGKDIEKKTVQEFLNDVEEVPSYFACSEY
jgi:hypothetical protein